ncbi:MAG: HAMP domain-containing protein [Proteobacteria bacterium]|nr:HAMP domain-containing protein [Pseudomonadota bacterium]
MKRRIALALRYRVMFAFWLFLVGGLVFVGVVYNRHNVIQGKLRLIEQVEELRNQILEARRFEKNFLLYGGNPNFEAMLEHLGIAKEHLDNLDVPWTTDSRENFVEESQKRLLMYRRAAQNYKGILDGILSGGRLVDISPWAQEFRNTGRTLTELIDETVKKERTRLDRLVSGQRKSLFYSLFGFMALAVAVAYYLFFQIVRPLAAINQAVKDITQGKVREIPHVPGTLEIQNLIRVLNSMIRELEKKFEQLIQREKLTSLGTLTSGVAHELNNPLSNISTSTQILLEEMDHADRESQERFLYGIEEQVEKAKDIVRSLLEFARQHEFEPTPVELTSLVNKTVHLMRTEIPPHVELIIQADEPLWVEADGRHLSQALMNVIMNSMQAMERREGSLTVRTRMEDERYAAIDVEDTGPGIEPENLSKVFDPFFTTKEVGKGTGLGLYIVYGIIRKHGGRVQITSEPGEGTTVTMILPLQQES